MADAFNTSAFEIDCNTVKSKLDAEDQFLLLDCREAEEFQHVHIEGATLVPMSEIQNRIAELESARDREVVVYCHHGMRSLQVAMWLQSQGFTNVKSLAGGIDAWSQLIDPTLPRY